MKKVVVFRSELLPTSETFILEQLRALTEWTPTLTGYRRVSDGLDLDDVDVRILPGLNDGRFQRWYLRVCQLFGVAHQPTTRALRALSPDLIHAHFGIDAVDLWPSVCDLHVPMVVTLHGFDINIYREWWEAGHGGWLRRSYPKRLLSMAGHPAVRFIAVSKAIKQRAIEYGIPADKITVAYIGVDTHRFRPGGLPLTQRARRILFVGRMVEKKAPQLLIRAFAEVRKQAQDAELVMIGAGPLLDDAKALAEELSLPVKFLGARTSDEVITQMHEARVFCLPSVTASNGDAEGLPISILEAQACGLPVVTSARGAVGEAIVDGRNGVCVAEQNIHSLVVALTRILQDQESLIALSLNALQTISANFSIADTAHTLSEEIYSSMISDKLIRE
jgi:glycosyltransferase involved in cell wall biosynthesis